MRQLLMCCGLLVLCAVETGCCRTMNRNCAGCGELYLGAYVDDPPRREPCDHHGNWVGGCGSCMNDCERFPWNRSSCRRAGFFDALMDSIAPTNSCCDATSCCEAGCGESSGSSCGCGSSGHEFIEHGESLSARSRPTSGVRLAAHHEPMSRQPRMTTQPQTVRPTMTSARPAVQSAKPCNCGKH